MNTLTVLLPSELISNRSNSLDAIFHYITTVYAEPAVPLESVVFPALSLFKRVIWKRE